MKLVVGLGNPGSEYATTRHNLGFMLIDKLADDAQVTVGRRECSALVGRIQIENVAVKLAKPQTYMNLSGRAVRYWMEKKKIPLERILVIADDIALPLSRIRLRGNGSAAGHNGLRSVSEELQTENYPRLRYGVGNQFPRGMQVEYVLGSWAAEEIPLIKIKNEKAVQIVESFVFMGLERTMNDYNKISITI